MQRCRWASIIETVSSVYLLALPLIGLAIAYYLGPIVTLIRMKIKTQLIHESACWHIHCQSCRILKPAILGQALFFAQSRIYYVKYQGNEKNRLTFLLLFFFPKTAH